MSRVPLRLRLTAVFAVAMAAVVAGAGYLTLARFQEAQREYRPATVIGAVQQTAQQTGQRTGMDDLREELLISLPIVLIVATLGAYLLAAAALRPVEHMRAQAAAVTEDTPGQRLDVPPSRDEIARLAATLNSMLDRLQQALDHERRFVAGGQRERPPAARLAAGLPRGDPGRMLVAVRLRLFVTVDGIAGGSFINVGLGVGTVIGVRNDLSLAEQCVRPGWRWDAGARGGPGQADDLRPEHDLEHGGGDRLLDVPGGPPILDRGGAAARRPLVGPANPLG